MAFFCSAFRHFFPFFFQPQKRHVSFSMSILPPVFAAAAARQHSNSQGNEGGKDGGGE